MSPIPYRQYLKSEDWQLKRLTVIVEWKGRCSVCGEEKYVNELQVHHEEYATNLREVPLDKLKPMCAPCHAKQHPKKL